VKTIQAYRFALDLTPSQERDVLAHAGAARVAHNWALAQVKAVMEQWAAERTYDVPDEQLTESLSWSLPALRKAWNAAKADVAPWWPEVSKEAFNTGLDALARGLKNWAGSRKGARAGRPVGFPRFKSRRRSTAPLWSKTSTSQACSPTGVWPGISQTPASPRSAASWRTRPPGTAAGCWWQTVGIRPRKPARAAAR
jgi:transposase